MKHIEDCFVVHRGQKLRCGYTTGSCAAAAAKAAAIMLLSNREIDCVTLQTPADVLLELDVLDIKRTPDYVRCAIQKDAGDDPDVTDRIMVYARVSKSAEQKVLIDGGIGVGRVTKPGLEQKVGSAAINRVPRLMIQEAVEEAADEYSYEGGFQVLIEIPDGAELAAKTFNPRLGIEGGISVLGTKGIVIPMSEEALLSSIEVELEQRLLQGDGYLLMTPGNYGEDFLRDEIRLDVTKNIRCSNFIGKTLDMAVNKGAKAVLLTGHIGKLIKIGAGIMDTHSRNADARAEEMAACAILAGADLDLARALLKAPTTDAMLDIISERGMLKPVMDILIERIYAALRRRSMEQLEIGIILFSNQYGLLAEKNADRLKEHFRCKE
ncbi:MAG: cobalt-precorrin-5B (C(1))-methyltransferase CbiD [Eubacterium sp.]|nr:cobalt-precorrin-5B (C(1))-methyltransferase CbiD [Eubacterium sp.]